MATDARDSNTETVAPPRLGGPPLLLGGAAFVALTVGVLWYQFQRIPTGATTPSWTRLSWGYLALLLLGIPVETAACALRMWLLCRVLQPGVRLWTCVKAEWANVAVSLLTPSQSGGGPGQIYLLSRDGVRVGTALTASLISFAGTMVGLLVLGLYSLLVTNLIVESPREFTHLVVSYLLLLVAQMACFLLFPVATPVSWRTINAGRTAAERFLAYVQRFDARSNSFPSMHTSVATLTALHLYESLGVWALAFPALIGLSCLFTKQHYVVDVPAGAALGWATFEVFRYVA